MTDDEDGVDDFIDEDRTLTQDIKYTITTYGADFLVDGLVSRFENGDIYVPDFQRDFVWTKRQASRFIESILLGLPIPGIFLYREAETNKFLIVDGLQRLSTLRAFVANQFPGSDKHFRLDKVNERFAGKLYKDLDPEDKRQLNNCVIHATVFQQTDPPAEQDEKASVYLVFERLNSGGTPLQPQEIRAALYHGAFSEFLGDLNKAASWRKIFGSANKRRKDEELVLRFLAFLYAKADYESPMVRFLNRFMAKHRNLGSINTKKAHKTFVEMCDFVLASLGENAFRPRRNLNVAVFDSVAVTVAESNLFKEIKPDVFRRRYEKLLADPTYIESISKSTSDDAVVEARFRKAAQILARK